ncbi:DUF4296 domain-containing protein [Coprobacter tertius]|uniref:DUF4296 domain-containing protein n=1 Tax=Coprobacter tertius TaxID=2944915 RepID=A0ABT1MHU9_9BACT|nr:DUF4296 domain-containing protein [Coprobacter tertius]MCP9612212.1 DUF4296 domain-containing protein [Coprobacter tertius]
MKTSFHIMFFSLFILIAFSACDRTPDGVLSPKKMEDLLVDVHKSEGLIDINYSQYNTEEQKKALRESILQKHNTTQAQFDTSLMWYGHHLDAYIKVYENVIQRLKKQEEQVNTLLANENTQPMSRPGDSVNIWKRPSKFIFEPQYAKQVFAFDIKSDENFRERDIFTFKFNFGMLPINTTDLPKAILALKYKDQSVKYTSANISFDGNYSLSISGDSARKIDKIFGSIMVPSQPENTRMYINNLSLLRSRYKKPKIQKPVDTHNDSIATSTGNK